MLTYIVGYQIEGSNRQVNKKAVPSSCLIIKNPERNGDSSGKPSKNRGFLLLNESTQVMQQNTFRRKKNTRFDPQKKLTQYVGLVGLAIYGEKLSLLVDVLELVVLFP